MASNTFETITITIATISLAIIATAISSGSLNGMNVAAAAAVTTISLTDQQPKVAALISTPPVSSSSALASATMPDYGITNVTAQVGTNAYLPCKVSGIVLFVFFLVFIFQEVESHPFLPFPSFYHFVQCSLIFNPFVSCESCISNWFCGKMVCGLWNLPWKTFVKSKLDINFRNSCKHL